MNAVDVLKYGHRTFMSVIDGLDETQLVTPNVCGWWSTREIIAHIASYEQALVDLLGQLGGSTAPTPALDHMQRDPGGFNDAQVSARDGKSAAELIAEYTGLAEQTQVLARALDPALFGRAGTLPWYGMEYDLDDFICYTYYGHKREHSAQVNVFRDTLS